MGETTAKVKLLFLGEERGVAAAAAKAESGVRRLGDTSVKTSKNVDRSADSVKRLGQAAESLGTAGKWVGLIGVAAGAGAAAIGASVPAVAALGLGFGVAKAAIGGSEQALKAYDKALKDGKGDFTEYNRLLKDMTPEQRAFTEAVVDTKKPLSDLQKTAGRSFLPGVTSFLKDSRGLFPILDTAVQRTGKIMGDTAEKLGKVFESDRFKRNLDAMLKTADPITRQIGDSFTRLIDKTVEFGASMGPAAEGLSTFLADATTGIEGFLDALVPHSGDFKSIFESLGSIIRDVLPLVGELAGEFSSDLAPILRDVAGWIRDNKDAIREWIPFLGQAAVGLAGLKIASTVSGWVSGLTGLIGGLGAKALDAGGKVAGFGTKLSGLKGAGGAAGVALAIGAVAFAIDDLNVKAAGGAQNLDGIAVNLHQFRDTVGKIFSGDIGFGRMVDQAKAAAMGIMNQFNGIHLTPIQLQVNGTPVDNELDRLIGEINSSVPEVNINGNVTGAGFALREIMAEISQGKAEIMIDGNPIPADEARQYVVSLINASNGTLNIDGDNKAAGDSLADIFGRVNAARPVLTIDGNTDPATGKTTQAVRFADGSKGTITVDGNTVPANGKTTGAVQFANGSRGTITVDGNQAPANGKINATVTYANGRTGTIQISASTGGAQGVIDGFIRRNDGRQIRIYTSVLGSGGIASAARLAAGGPVQGPGTGTSDTAGLFALSNGEFVATKREVDNAGGPAAFGRLMDALDRGPVGMAAGGSPMRASAQAAMRTPMPASSAGGGRVQLVVAPGGDSALATLIMRMVRENKIQLKVA